MIKDKYILKPTDIEYIINDHFPKLADGKSVGVFLSGGMESSLIAKICVEVYGKDRVVLFYSDKIFSSNEEGKNKKIFYNVTHIAELLGMPVNYIEFNFDLHNRDTISSAKAIWEQYNQQHNIDFVMWGFTKLFFDVAPLKKIKNISDDEIEDICYGDTKKYRSVIEEFHLPTGRWTSYVSDIKINDQTYDLIELDNKTFKRIKCPFRVLNKSEVVDLYRQLEIYDLVFETNSCVRPEVLDTTLHCGKCFNCQQRHDAFRILKIEDKTQYLHNDVIGWRNQLELFLN